MVSSILLVGFRTSWPFYGYWERIRNRVNNLSYLEKQVFYLLSWALGYGQRSGNEIILNVDDNQSAHGTNDLNNPVKRKFTLK